MAADTVYVVTQIVRDDDAQCPHGETTPIAAFFTESDAADFVSYKRAQEYLYLDWDITPVPLKHRG
jgi:hypothetical protein